MAKTKKKPAKGWSASPASPSKAGRVGGKKVALPAPACADRQAGKKYSKKRIAKKPTPQRAGRVGRKKTIKKIIKTSRVKTPEVALSLAEDKLKRSKNIKIVKVKNKNKKHYFKVKKLMTSLASKKPRAIINKVKATVGEIKIIKDNPYLHKKSPYVLNLKRNTHSPLQQIESIKNVKPLISKNFASIKQPASKLIKPKKHLKVKFSTINIPKFTKPQINIPQLQIDKKSLLQELFIINVFQIIGIIIYSIFVGVFQAFKSIFNFIQKIISVIIRPSIKKAAGGYFLTVANIFKIIGEIIIAPFAFIAWLIKNANNKVLALEIVPPEGWHKKLLSFCLISIIIILPLRGIAYYKSFQETKGEILDIGATAFNHLGGGTAVSFTNPEKANEEFSQALENFQTIKQQLGGLSSSLIKISSVLPTENKVAGGSKIILAGENIAEAGKILTNVFADIENEETKHLTQKIYLLQEALKKSLPFIKSASLNITNVNDEIIPKNYREVFAQAQKQLPLLAENINNFTQFSDALLNIIGHEQTKRYLIFFQNNAELRPTGGFLGSFALLDIDRGEIKNLEIPNGGTYDMNGGLKEYILAPEPLHLVNTRWQLQDANWFADFPTSAEKIMWFYEKRGGPTVDGIITITPTVIEKLLTATGPVNMEENYGLTVNASNFWRIVQKEAEKKFYETTESKKIIGDLADKLVNKILDSGQDEFIQILQILNESLNQKDVLLYFKENNLENTITNLGWGGQMRNAPRDYLSIINTNIAGGKSDRVIDEEISLQTKILTSGEIINSVKITRTHKGQEGEEFTGVTNIDYLRLYVPQGSKLLSVQGQKKPEKNLFDEPEENLIPDESLINIEKTIDPQTGTEIYNESNKTVFANWLEIKPGHSRSLTFSYKLPFSLELNQNKKSIWNIFQKETKAKYLYSLLVQKQPGTNSKFIHTIKLPDDLRMYWKYPNNMKVANADDTWGTITNLDTDKIIAFILQK